MTDMHDIVVSETLEQAIDIIENKEVRGYKDVCESCAAEWDAAIAHIKREGKRLESAVEKNAQLRSDVKTLREIDEIKDQIINYKNESINNLREIVNLLDPTLVRKR